MQPHERSIENLSNLTTRASREEFSARPRATPAAAKPEATPGCSSSGRTTPRRRPVLAVDPAREDPHRRPRAPGQSALADRARLSGLKQELGLGHYEGRGWRGFHHHAALCIAAYGFLVAERAAFPLGRQRRKDGPGGRRSQPSATPRLLPVGPERHVPHSIATMRRRIAHALAQLLPQCPCCSRSHHQSLINLVCDAVRLVQQRLEDLELYGNARTSLVDIRTIAEYPVGSVTACRMDHYTYLALLEYHYALSREASYRNYWRTIMSNSSLKARVRIVLSIQGCLCSDFVLGRY
jgi:hypothetical protein